MKFYIWKIVGIFNLPRGKYNPENKERIVKIMSENTITIKEALMRAYAQGWMDRCDGKTTDDRKYEVADELAKKLPENSQ